MFKKFLAAVSVIVLGATASVGTNVSAASYDPVGVQNDVAVSDVLGGGWSVIYSGTYDQSNIDLSTVFAGASDMVMLAARLVGSDTFDVLAAVEASVFLPLQTALNATVTSNGAEWYKNGDSMGFAGLGDTITKSTADTNGQSERDRLSWHTNLEIGQNPSAAASILSYGWRSGDNVWLNTSSNWERLVLTKSMSPVPVPAGLPLLLGGLGAFGLVQRRKRRAA